MKKGKWISLLLVLTVLIGTTVSACGESALKINYTGSANISVDGSGTVLTTTIGSTVSGQVNMVLYDVVDKVDMYSDVKYGVSNGEEVAWSIPYLPYVSQDSPIKRVMARFSMDGVNYDYYLFMTYGTDSEGVPYIKLEKPTWYSNRVACTIGIPFCDVKPELTDEWYMFTPLDLSEDSVQTYDYVAGNLYIIGTVTVTVDGDALTVDYKNYYDSNSGNTKTLSEYFTFFSDLGSVTDVDPKTMIEQNYLFGQPISISKDLDGDTEVLLYVNNTVTYCDYANSTHKLVRYWPNLAERKEARDIMMQMLDSEL